MQYAGIELRELDGDLYFEDLALAETHDGHSSDIKRKAWMDKNGVNDSQASYCLGKVLYGRAHKCATSYWPRMSEIKPPCKATQDHSHEWFDHSQMFWDARKRQYILAAQPYDVSLEKYQEMEQFASQHGLSVTISLIDAWWYPGRTPLIVWRKKD